VLLELGGKAPLIVLEDADLDEAVKAAAFGAYMNQGQICMSTERIIVVDAIADAFAEALAEKAKSLAADGPGLLGAMIGPESVDHINALIDDALANGGKILAGGRADDVLMAATLVDRVTPAMKLFSDESFGPIVGITRARDEEEAIRLANDSRYGLSASVFTRDTGRGLRVARRIKSGICHVNGPTVADEPQMPFGGVGDSGHGRFGGSAGIDAFTELRWITIATEPNHYPI
jgi:acyl-CoA reductase-like NAD-dependent aldehyde dehydrogenase